MQLYSFPLSLPPSYIQGGISAFPHHTIKLFFVDHTVLVPIRLIYSRDGGRNGGNERG